MKREKPNPPGTRNTALTQEQVSATINTRSPVFAAKSSSRPTALAARVGDRTGRGLPERRRGDREHLGAGNVNAITAPSPSGCGSPLPRRIGHDRPDGTPAVRDATLHDLVLDGDAVVG